jgi:LPXTG-motif cell wall-anchored protein
VPVVVGLLLLAAAAVFVSRRRRRSLPAVKADVALTPRGGNLRQNELFKVAQQQEAVRPRVQRSGSVASDVAAIMSSARR